MVAIYGSLQWHSGLVNFQQRTSYLQTPGFQSHLRTTRGIFLLQQSFFTYELDPKAKTCAMCSNNHVSKLSRTHAKHEIQKINLIPNILFVID